MTRFTTSIRSLARGAVFSLLFCAGLAALPASAHASCRSCGTVIASHTYQRPAAHGSGVGMVTGAVAGGLLGNQVGGGNGRTLATVAGAVGGGYAGNTIERHMRSTTVTQVRVRMANGTIRNFTEAGQARWAPGAQVRVVHGGLAPRA
jgi:outer membrane lipoprotein SlyB